MLIRSVFVGTALRSDNIQCVHTLHQRLKYRVYSQLCVGLMVWVTQHLSTSETCGGK